MKPWWWSVDSSTKQYTPWLGTEIEVDFNTLQKGVFSFISLVIDVPSDIEMA